MGILSGKSRGNPGEIGGNPGRNVRGNSEGQIKIKSRGRSRERVLTAEVRPYITARQLDGQKVQ